MKSIHAGKRLTVIIRDDAPMIHCGDVPSKRRVTVDLTSEQIEKLRLFSTSSQSGVDIFESVSFCFLEENEESNDKMTATLSD